MKKKIAISVLTILLLAYGFKELVGSQSFQLLGKIIEKVDTSDRVVALTLDDGPWNAKNVSKVLATLKTSNVKATFFFNGFGIEKYPQVVEAVVADGHDLGNHAFNHDRMIFKSYSVVKGEIESTTRLIRNAGYKREIYFRPPHGKKFLVLPYYLDEKGIVTVMADVQPESDLGIKASATEMVNHVVQNAKPGSIILLHPFGSKNDSTRDALPEIIKRLKQEGFRFELLTNLLKDDELHEDR